MARRRGTVVVWLAVLVGLVVVPGGVAGWETATGVAADGPAVGADRASAFEATDDTMVAAGRLASEADSVAVTGGHATALGGPDLLDQSSSPAHRLVDGPWELPLSALLVGYSRRAASEPLTNEARQQVYESVQANPGAHIAAIAERSGVARSTARYHLRVLEDASLVDGGMVSGKHRYAPAGDDLAVAAALHDGPSRAVLEGVARTEPSTVSALAEEVDRATSTVSHHLDRLVDAGLVERERADGRVLVRLSADAGFDDGHPDPLDGAARVADLAFE